METKGLLKKISDKAQSLYETLNEMFHKGITIQEIADMVKNHDNRKKTTKTLLGITYHFYKLQLNSLTFYLETKESASEQILYLKVYTLEHIVFTYRSYEDGLSLKDQIKVEHFPDIVKRDRLNT